jgi:hypothetical protein
MAPRKVMLDCERGFDRQPSLPDPIISLREQLDVGGTGLVQRS